MAIACIQPFSTTSYSLFTSINEYIKVNINAAIIIVHTPNNSQFIAVEGEEFISLIMTSKRMVNNFNNSRS